MQPIHLPWVLLLMVQATTYRRVPNDELSKVSPSGVRTVIYSFPANTQPMDVAIDGAGNYIVTETGTSQLSMITPSGVRTVIHNFGGIGISGVAIDGAGNYIVAERDELSMITPSNVRTVIYSFVSGSYPMGIAIDGAGNYIVAERGAGLLSMITPSGVRSVVYNFGTQDDYVAIVPGAMPSGYSATIWGWDALDSNGWIAEPITMDGTATGFSTPHTFTGLSGTHTFTVPGTDVDGRAFGSWDTGETSTTLTVTSGGTHTAQYAAYSAIIWSWDALDPAGWIAEPITMDGTSTGYSTPHTFTLTGTHTFSVPGTDVDGRAFGSWDTGETSTTLTVTSGGTHTAQYASYVASIEAYDPLGDVWSQIPEPITMDGASTGFSTPHTFTGLTGSHTFTASSTDVYGYPFKEWDNLYATATITVNSMGIYRAIYMYPLTVSLTPTSWTMDVGQSELFTAAASGGTMSSTAYWWHVDSMYQSGVPSSTLNYVPSSAGSHTVDVSAYNEITFPQNGEMINIYSNEVVATITVNSALSTPSASATPSTVNQSQSSTLSVTGLSGGTTPYSYQWLQKAPGAGSYSTILGATSNTYVFSTSSSTATGTWSFEVNVTDSASSPVTVTSNAASVTVNILPKVVTPTFSPSAGTYTSSQSVTLGCSTSGATIRYTTDGSEPSSSSILYSSPFSVYTNMTLKAKAFETDMTDSDTASATYTIYVPVVPEFPTVTANMIVLAFLGLALLFAKRKLVPLTSLAGSRS